ncbi:MAG: hypothetical protein N4A54_12030 [Peptostreptococcaceae bacterium]|nr:hypothetical protein [Peptostreptococcaceae bacterium]
MVNIKTKEELLNLYVKRYDELDSYAKENLSQKYDEILKDFESKNINTKDSYENYFDELEKKNEELFKLSTCECLESSPAKRFTEILASYGVIVFFRTNLIK